MQRATLAALIGLTIILAATPAFAQRRRGGGNANILEQNCWQTDYNKAKAIAARTGQPMMVVFRCVP